MTTRPKALEAEYVQLAPLVPFQTAQSVATNPGALIIVLAGVYTPPAAWLLTARSAAIQRWAEAAYTLFKVWSPTAKSMATPPKTLAAAFILRLVLSPAAKYMITQPQALVALHAVWDQLPAARYITMQPLDMRAALVLQGVSLPAALSMATYPIFRAAGFTRTTTPLPTARSIIT
jgi:hypothetical protein